MNKIKLFKETPALLKKWVFFVNNLDVDSATNLYGDNAILLATFETILLGKNQIKGYFKEFLDKQQMKCEIIENFTKINSKCNIVVSNGIYQFTYVENDVSEKVTARYTFVSYNDLIFSHHSSIEPT